RRAGHDAHPNAAHQQSSSAQPRQLPAPLPAVALQQLLPFALGPRRVAAQLAQVVARRAAAAEAPAALLQVQQCHLGTLRRPAHEQVLGIQAAVLPAALVHARQGRTDLLQQGVMLLAGLLAAAGGVPAVDVAEAVQCLGNQQPAPALAGLIVAAAVDQARYADAQAAQAIQRIALAQHRGPAERMCRAAAQVADLPLDIEQAPVELQALYPALPAPATVGLFDPLALQLPPVFELAGAPYRRHLRQHRLPTTVQIPPSRLRRW